jgi:ATP-dependent DNA helicase RecG
MIKRETQHIEFKSKFNEDVIETLVAFANAKGGKVLVGVNDDGQPVKNFTIGKESLQNWINEIKIKTQPSIIPDAETIEYEGGEIVEFSIQEYPVKPVSCRGKYFKRIKNSNHLLSVTEVVNLHLQYINSSWDAYPDPIHGLDEISFDKVQQSIETLKAKGQTINESPLSFLLKSDLIRDDKPTNAAYLLFKANNTSIGTTIELGRFQDLITIKDTSRTKSDIVTQVNEVLDFVKKHINLEIIITGEAQNIQKWQYPMEAIRELVLNMIIHRDYCATADSVVKIFNNKIEFFNPGTLPEELTIEKLLANDYKSIPRNKVIAEFFKNLGLIEKYGSGIGRIINYFKEENLPSPEFRLQSGGFLVTVFMPETGNETVEKTVEETVETVEKTKDAVEKILQFMEKKPTITQSELVQKTGLTRRGVEWNIAKLKSLGLITREGSDKGGYWKVISTISSRNAG